MAWPDLVTDPDALDPQIAARFGLLYRRLVPRLQAGEAGLAERLAALLTAVMARIDCTACGRCCRHTGPVVDEADATRLAAGLGLSVAGLRRRFLRPMWPGAAEVDQVWLLPAPCPFHDGRLCTVYPHRPQPCRDFPQAVGADPVERLAVWVETAAFCPITFNTLAWWEAEEGEPEASHAEDAVGGRFDGRVVAHGEGQGQNPTGFGGDEDAVVP